MKIEKNTMVTLTYDLMIDDENGEIVEQTTDKNPLQFLFGAGMMLQKFESNLAGIGAGDHFEMKLNSRDAYGEVNEEAIVELPKHIFLVDDKFDEEYIKAGNTIPMMSGGQRLNGVVLDVTEDAVRMDFNHPLAGEDLYFKGKVLEVREASEEEIMKAFAGSSGCSGCSSGSCGDEDYSGGGCGSGCCC